MFSCGDVCADPVWDAAEQKPRHSASRSRQQRSHLLLVLPAHSVRVSPAFEPDWTTDQSCIHMLTWGRSRSTTTHQQGELSRWFYPQDPCLPHLKLFKHSAQWVSLLLSSRGDLTVQTQSPGDETTPAEIATVPDNSMVWQPQPQRQAGGVNCIPAGQACPTVLQTRSTHTSLLPKLLRQRCQARLKFFSVGKVLVLPC